MHISELKYVYFKPNRALHGQQHTEAALRSHLKRYGVEVELATELRSFEQNPDHVVAHIVKNKDGAYVQEETQVRFLVGADGAKGGEFQVS